MKVNSSRMVDDVFTRYRCFLCRLRCRKLQAEYDRLKKAHDRKGLSPLPSPPEMLPVSPQSARDAELIAEAKLLRQHKGRLEARMQILEDHNKQLESQLHRLRQLLEQVRRVRKHTLTRDQRHCLAYTE